jgi:hypothetical protein
MKVERWHEKWDNLSHEKRDLYLRILWEDGFSEKAIAEFLQSTKGRIVVYRQRILMLPTAGRPKKTAADKVVTVEHFRDLLDIAAMNNLQARGVITATAASEEAAVRNEASEEAVEEARRKGKVVALKPRRKRKGKSRAKLKRLLKLGKNNRRRPHQNP